MPKRYNVVLSDKMWAELEAEARRKGVPVIEILRSCVNLGLYLAEAKRTDAEILLRDPDGTITKLLLINS